MNEQRDFLPLFLRTKWRLANNHLTNLHRHKLVHLGVALMLVVMLVGGGSILFDMVFSYVVRLEIFGRPLMNRLIQMVLLAFFSMLIFSNLIIMLTTTYLSREVEFLMALPIRPTKLFFSKLGESVIYSSWAFVILAFPFFIAIGSAWEARWYFYPMTIVLVVPYLIIPAAIGAWLAMVISAWFPARHTFRYAVALGAIGLVSALIANRFYGFGSFMRGRSTDELASLMRFLRVADHWFLPSGWLGRGLVALERGDWQQVTLWGGALWTSALQGLLVCDWLAKPLYYKGWNSAKSSASPRRNRRQGYYSFFDRLLSWLPSPTRAMITKDVAVFWRDPTQWGQLMVLFGLLVIYLINLRNTSGMGRLEAVTTFFRSYVALFNIGATGFVLSILTTRFVFPLLSLEGKQQWVIGLAPQARSRAVWIKFVVNWISSLLFTLPLTVLSSYMLQTDRTITLLSLGTVVMLSLGLNSLAVGLGASLPNFSEDNPARIANGLGGTINIVVSMIYIGLTLLLETPWIFQHINGSLTSGWWRLMLYGSLPLWVLLQLAMFAVPLAIGLKRWQQIEY